MRRFAFARESSNHTLAIALTPMTVGAGHLHSSADAVRNESHENMDCFSGIFRMHTFLTFSSAKSAGRAVTYADRNFFTRATVYDAFRCHCYRTSLESTPSQIYQESYYNIIIKK